MCPYCYYTLLSVWLISPYLPDIFNTNDNEYENEIPPSWISNSMLFESHRTPLLDEPNNQ